MGDAVTYVIFDAISEALDSGNELKPVGTSVETFRAAVEMYRSIAASMSLYPCYPEQIKELSEGNYVIIAFRLSPEFANNKNLRVSHIAEDGTVRTLTSRVENGYIYFETRWFD